MERTTSIALRFNSPKISLCRKQV